MTDIQTRLDLIKQNFQDRTNSTKDRKYYKKEYYRR